jgi:phage shock protein PspC (stress-responsive transcriptional regulator)
LLLFDDGQMSDPGQPQVGEKSINLARFPAGMRGSASIHLLCANWHAPCKAGGKMIGMVPIGQSRRMIMSNQTAPAAPRDNLFGICHALGETFGFNPIFLRIALLGAMMANPEATLIAYFTAGIAVLIAKLATRERRPARRKQVMALTQA